jgi:hypothetical protein
VRQPKGSRGGIRGPVVGVQNLGLDASPQFLGRQLEKDVQQSHISLLDALEDVAAVAGVDERHRHDQRSLELLRHADGEVCDQCPPQSDVLEVTAAGHGHPFAQQIADILWIELQRLGDPLMKLLGQGRLAGPESPVDPDDHDDCLL